MSEEFASHLADTKLNLNESNLEFVRGLVAQLGWSVRLIIERS